MGVLGRSMTQSGKSVLVEFSGMVWFDGYMGHKTEKNNKNIDGDKEKQYE